MRRDNIKRMKTIMEELRSKEKRAKPPKAKKADPEPEPVEAPAAEEKMEEPKESKKKNKKVVKKD